MIKKKKQYNTDLINTVVGKDAHFKGDIHTHQSVRIEGSFEGGEINSQGEVFVGLGSKVKANIIAKRVLIVGEVIGNIETTAGLRIGPTGQVYGDLTGDQLIIEEGAVFKGKVNMDVVSSRKLVDSHLTLAKAS